MNNLVISISPHVKSKWITSVVMLDVIVALLPTLVASVLSFGLRALIITTVCVAAAVLSEFIFEKACKRPVTLYDLSAIVTGILLAFNLPISIPLWQAAFGSVVAIIVVKQLFGGIGMNFANPAITARIVLLIAFGSTLSHWVSPDAVKLTDISGAALADLTTSATPLASLVDPSAKLPALSDMFLGNIGGCIGETCSLTLLIGGIYLMVKRVITPHIPLIFIGTVFVLSLILAPAELSTSLNVTGIANLDYAIYQLLSGGLIIGAFFMATDYVTSPVTGWGKVIFAVGCGFIAFMIRRYGSLPEGVSYAILFMNILTPYINKWTTTRPFGVMGGAK
ncbi:MAG: RnfABCDGE type electron transport complex subunit D [Clostridia bacterium]|nr:RnfABCDGE type electron transport complex subunit D [Clostridia bacterium]